MIIDTRGHPKSKVIRAAVIGSVIIHIIAWMILTEMGSRPISQSYLVQLVLKEKEKPDLTPEEKPKPKVEKAEMTPPPLDEFRLKELQKQQQKIEAEFKMPTHERRKDEPEIVTLNDLNRRQTDYQGPTIANLNMGKDRGDGPNDAPLAKFIAIGSGRKGGIGISSDGAGSISINIGSGLGGGRGAGRGSGTGNGPDVPNVFLGGVGTGGRGGGGGGGGGGIQIGSLPGAGNRKGSGTGTGQQVVLNNVDKQQRAKEETGVSGEWVVADIAGAIAGLQIRCLNNPGYHVYGNMRIQCDNNVIVAAWVRR